MERIVVRGGAPLSGRVQASGSKNSTLALIAASILGSGETTLLGLPRVRDVEAMVDLVRSLGVRADWDTADPHALTLCADALTETDVPYELMGRLRGSFMVLGPLLARFGCARVSRPGGCAIGDRPIDLHLEALEALGTKVRRDAGRIEATASPLMGRTFRFERVTVGGTQNLMMAASRAFGVTVLENAAREPEVRELAFVLRSMGADVRGEASGRIVVRGVGELHGVRHVVESDRIETGTLLAAGILTGGDVTVCGARPGALGGMLPQLEECGADVEIVGDAVRVRAPSRPRAIDVATAPFPGFPTDMQPPLMALLAVAEGESRITESIFENRFQHVAGLAAMGAEIAVVGRVATVRGVRSLSGAEVEATDLRASAALLLAGLAAEGRSVVNRAEHMDRGYERIEQKLTLLGADVCREG